MNFLISSLRSNPLLFVTKETSFVYQAKRGFFLLFGAKHT